MIIPAETIKLKDMKEYLLRSTEESDASVSEAVAESAE